MCGICGFTDFNNSLDHLDFKRIINEMSNQIIHRGPDSGNYKRFKNTVLGFRRLAIQDLSKKGNQPFISSSTKSVIVFNGEIYNFLELKRKYFSNFNFVSGTDTEVMLELIEKIGIDKTLLEIEGMFAFAYYDIENKEIFLARDRMGKKPLYYTLQNNTLVFGSELKCLFKFPGLKFEIDNGSLEKFFLFGYVPTPFSIFKNIFKLEQSTYIKIDYNQNVTKKRFWDIDLKKINKFQFNQDHFEDLIKNSVKKRMISDAPLGTFLSGGVDSTLVSMLSTEYNNEIKSFSIGNIDDRYDESEFCFKASELLGTDHNQNYINKNLLLKTVNSLHKFYDEPFADSSQIPTIINSHYASKHVKVCLSGDGGDELFGGYPRYFHAKRYNTFLKKFNFLKYLPNFKVNNRIDKLLNKLKYIKADNISEIYQEVVIQSHNRSLLEEQDGFINFNPWNKFKEHNNLNTIDTCRLIDLKTYLIDDILTKVDRGSMSKSIEVRSPLLDHKIVEYAFYNKFDMNEKYTKSPLRKMLEKKFSRSFFMRRKQGFSVPIEKIMLNELNEKCCEYFSHNNLKKYDINQNFIKNNWKAIKNGNFNNIYGMWFIFIYLDWHHNWKNIITK